MATRTTAIQPGDLGFFSALVSGGSLSATARELGITTAAISKRLSQMEARLGVPLINRTTRRMSLTPDGELYLEHARKILDDIDNMAHSLGLSKSTPSGLLRVNATLGFGRTQIAPITSRFVRKYPGVEVRLQLSVDPPPLNEDVFDVCIRFGPPPDARIIARHIAPNRRLLCASPAYLAQHGEPRVPADLARHNFISIRQGEEAYGVLRLARGRGGAVESVKVRGNLTTNDGEVAVNWALEGHGILMRAEWDIERYLRSGRLIALLPQYQTPNADIHAVYPQRHQATARVRAFVDFVALSLSRTAGSAASQR